MPFAKKTLLPPHEDFVVSGQAGLVYANFGGITDLTDGFGGLLGVRLGVAVDSGVWLTYDPQVAFAGPQDFIVFHLFGIGFEF